MIKKVMVNGEKINYDMIASTEDYYDKKLYIVIGKSKQYFVDKSTYDLEKELYFFVKTSEGERLLENLDGNFSLSSDCIME